MRAVAAGFSLWDVKNVEAHVHTTLDAALDEASAWLNPQQYARAFAYLLSKCWELSGLEADGRTLRYVWEVRGFVAPRGPLEQYEPIKLPQFPAPEIAAVALAAIAAARTLTFTSVERVRPRGAYDPRFGLSFSTYSRGILTKRLADWYRSDDDFGDDRYASSRRNEESIEALSERGDPEHDTDGGWLDRRGPGSRLEFVDQLNPHAYQESLEEILMRETQRAGEVLARAAVSG